MKRALIATSSLLFALTANGSVLRIRVNDMIHPISDEYIGRALADAARAHESAVIIDLSTAGGLIDSTRSIVEKMMTSPVPVIVYVAPAGSRAASAGFFILEAADIAAMAPGTNTGAAHPVILGEKMDEVMKTKIENDAAAFMRTIAVRRGRNVAVAESAVRQSKSFTEDEALQQKLIDIIAPNLTALLRAADGRQIRRYDGSVIKLHLIGQPIRAYDMSLKERLLSMLMDPNIAFLLFSLGALAIFAELNHPGAAKSRDHRPRRHDRRNRHRSDATGAGGQSVRSRRTVERCRENHRAARRARPRRRHRRPAVDRRARGVAGCERRDRRRSADR